MTTPIWLQRLLSIAISLGGIALILFWITMLYSAQPQIEIPLLSWPIVVGSGLVLIGISNLLEERYPHITRWLRISAWLLGFVMVILIVILYYSWFGRPTNPPPIPPTVTSS